MAGVELQKRFPKVFGWFNDGSVGISGVISSLCVLFNCYPSKKDLGGKEGWQPFQVERNAASAVFAFMQMNALSQASLLGKPIQAHA